HWWPLPSAAMLAVSFSIAAVPTAHAAPPSCTRTPNATGVDVVCDRGVPEGTTLEGTDGNDRFYINGAVAGTLNARGGDDLIIVTGRNGGHGGKGGNGYLDSTGRSGKARDGRNGTDGGKNGGENGGTAGTDGAPGPSARAGGSAGTGGHGGAGGPGGPDAGGDVGG